MKFTEARRDDDLEATVKTTIVLNDEKQGALNYAGQTVAILGQARESIAEVVKNLQLARNHSTMGTFMSKELGIQISQLTLS